jgi:hypothetical protein
MRDADGHSSVFPSHAICFQVRRWFLLMKAFRLKVAKAISLRWIGRGWRCVTLINPLQTS